MSDDATVIPLTPQRMSETDYNRERQRIRDLFGDSKADAGGRWEQALAKLFWQSGWHQDEIAVKENKKQPWVSKRIQFGRFLSFCENIPDRNNHAMLTENKFRSYWERTSGSNIQRRFREVAEMIEADARAPKRNLGASKAIRDRFADGKWHSIERIAAALPEIPVETITMLLSRNGHGVTGVKREIRQRGSDKQVRLFPTEKTVSTLELTEKLRPLIDDLRAEGRKNMATIAISRIAMIAAELQQLLAEWTR